MGTDARLQFARHLEEASHLRDDLRDTITARSVGQSSVWSRLAAEAAAIAFHGIEPDAPPLTIAFIGPFNAGKSSLLKCLTGDSDIVVRGEPVGHNVEAYEWRQLCILDSPGIAAGRPAHEATSGEAIRRADLILFVITPNLFDDETAAALRRLSVDGGRAMDLLLVINKAVSLGGDRAVLERAVAGVIEPLGIELSDVVWTEARAWLDAADQPAEIAADLIDESGIPRLESAIDMHVARRGLTARLTRPLHEMRRIAGEAAAEASPLTYEAEAALRTLRRKARLLSAAEERLRQAVLRLVSRAAARIESCGDTAAAAIVVGAKEEDVRRALDEQSAQVSTIMNEAPRAIEQEIEKAWRELQSEVERIAGHTTEDQQVQAVSEPSNNGRYNSDDFRVRTPANLGRSSNYQNLGKYAELVEKAGKLLGGAATGAKGGSSILTSSGAAGSNAHQIIYQAGKFIGVKFRPWEAVKYAKWVGNAGRVLGIAGAALTVILAFHEQRQELQAEAAALDARKDVRAHFTSYATQFEQAGIESLERFLAGSFGVELSEIAADQQKILLEETQRSEQAQLFLTLAERAAQLANIISAEDGSTAPIRNDL